MLISNKTYSVSGMQCKHCATHVQKAVEALEGVKSVSIDLAEGRMQVSGEIVPETVTAAVEAAGYACRLEG